RESNKNCLLTATPEDHSQAGKSEREVSDLQQFVDFMRLSAPPAAVHEDDPSVQRGRQVFVSTGCALCHTPTLRTSESAVGALSNKEVHRYSDRPVHRMGSELADDVIQGGAGPDEFRTAPLWGLGQRIWFLHDGRTNTLVVAIREHASSGSEANGVTGRSTALSREEQQDLLYFLRSL